MNPNKWVKSQKTIVFGFIVIVLSLFLVNYYEAGLNYTGLTNKASVIRVLWMIYPLSTAITTIDMDKGKFKTIYLLVPFVWTILNVFSYIKSPLQSPKIGMLVFVIGYIIMVLGLLEDEKEFVVVVRKIKK